MIKLKCCDFSKPDERIDIQLKTIASNYKVLADPIRLKILYLLRNGELCVCEITEALGLSQPKISYHLKILTDSGLIQRRSDWTWSYYSLTEGLKDWFQNKCSILKLIEEEER
ncbi:MAG: metalloregulator ArsR/SmtB family transcription factor [Bacillota bacterium]|nr:metalloregulator ArsR/SmtB family transcription factor [Bacillota bacterium]